jgi:AmiR/NasT family two-component response regulator
MMGWSGGFADRETARRSTGAESGGKMSNPIKSSEEAGREMAHLIRNYIEVVAGFTRRLRDRHRGDPATLEILDRLEQRGAEFLGQSDTIKEGIPVTKVPPLRIVVVEDYDDVRAALVATVEEANHEVVGQAATGPDMVKVVHEQKPDLVLFDIHLPGMDGFVALKQITRDRPVPAVVITGDLDVELVGKALEDYVLGYIIKPTQPKQVLAAIQVAWARWKQYEAVAAERDEANQRLATRKVVERAKERLHKQYGWSESVAFKAIQQAATKTNKKLGEVAQMILDGKNVFREN